MNDTAFAILNQRAQEVRDRLDYERDNEIRLTEDLCDVQTVIGRLEVELAAIEEAIGGDA